MREGGISILLARPSGGAAGPIDQSDDRRRIAGADDAGAVDAATRALCEFLAGFGIGAAERRDLVARLLQGARAHRRAHPDEDLAACAMLHAEQAFEAWLTAVLGAERLVGQPALPIGRAAFLACGGPTTWRHLILVHEALPEAFVAAMRAAAPSPSPAPTPATMAAQSLESWSIADAGRAVVDVVDGQLAWFGHARPLMTVPIKLTKPGA